MASQSPGLTPPVEPAATGVGSVVVVSHTGGSRMHQRPAAGIILSKPTHIGDGGTRLEPHVAVAGGGTRERGPLRRFRSLPGMGFRPGGTRDVALDTVTCPVSGPLP